MFKSLLIAFLIGVAIALTSCGSEADPAGLEPKEPEEKEPDLLSIAVTELPSCKKGNLNQLAYHLTEKKFYTCTSGGDWAEVDINGKDGSDGSDGQDYLASALEVSKSYSAATDQTDVCDSGHTCYVDHLTVNKLKGGLFSISLAWYHNGGYSEGNKTGDFLLYDNEMIVSWGIYEDSNPPGAGYYAGIIEIRDDLTAVDLYQDTDGDGKVSAGDNILDTHTLTEF